MDNKQSSPKYKIGDVVLTSIEYKKGVEDALCQGIIEDALYSNTDHKWVYKIVGYNWGDFNIIKKL